MSMLAHMAGNFQFWSISTANFSKIRIRIVLITKRAKLSDYLRRCQQGGRPGVLIRNMARQR